METWLCNKYDYAITSNYTVPSLQVKPKVHPL